MSALRRKDLCLFKFISTARMHGQLLYIHFAIMMAILGLVIILKIMKNSRIPKKKVRVIRNHKNLFILSVKWG